MILHSFVITHLWKEGHIKWICDSIKKWVSLKYCWRTKFIEEQKNMFLSFGQDVLITNRIY